jgi:hypothetical protein
MRRSTRPSGEILKHLKTNGDLRKMPFALPNGDALSEIIVNHTAKSLDPNAGLRNG